MSNQIVEDLVTVLEPKQFLLSLNSLGGGISSCITISQPDGHHLSAAK